jgi:hypothetical protein
MNIALVTGGDRGRCLPFSWSRASSGHGERSVAIQCRRYTEVEG